MRGRAGEADAAGAPVYAAATPADIPAMAALRLAVRENVLSDPGRVTLQMYADCLERLGRGWVCKRGATAPGFSCAAREDHTIWAPFVAPDCEGRGIGKALLALATDWLFAAGAGAVGPTTGARTRADGFYLAQGWRRGATANPGDVRYTLARPASSP
ncbi:GNAT family N-acetyltransferase [Janthinobacterium sp.]|uniref:GNAT family N-acetyltransferase n=1 Tax=Janthinobacterium sp. TaxID=1871054 RepID=UPI00293D4738|nr:GNAT family N-acetyltransferase [Janthinobacterium sp.]